MPRTVIDDRYALGRLLGSGGMAEVYLAHDEVLDRDVALKVLKDQYAGNEEFVRLFRREAKSAAALNHHNIVPIYVWGHSEDGTYYMTMEYVSGGTLKDRVRAGGSLDQGTAVELASQVAQALGFAHERGVIHRDIKPQNVLLTGTGDVKVADFGIARAAAATTTASRLGLVLGTAGYMSPEQAKGDPVGPQSDLYSLGVILYEMLTGELPHDAEDPVAIAGKHVNERPRPPSEVNPGVSGLLDGPTMRLLAKNPDERYASAAELVEDLERVRLELPRYVAAGERPTGEANAPSTPLLHPGQKETEIQPPPGTPVMEIFASGRRRWSMISLVLAALLLGVTLIISIAYLWSQS